MPQQTPVHATGLIKRTRTCLQPDMWPQEFGDAGAVQESLSPQPTPNDFTDDLLACASNGFLRRMFIPSCEHTNPQAARRHNSTPRIHFQTPNAASKSCSQEVLYEPVHEQKRVLAALKTLQKDVQQRSVSHAPASTTLPGPEIPWTVYAETLLPSRVQVAIAQLPNELSSPA